LGKCPTADHADRLEEQECNTQECVGDEICVAMQDLVIAVDSSGSLRESGFETVKKFVANFTGRYQAEYFGAEAMRVGVILFGQGSVQEDGTITPAEMVSELTDDIPSLKEKIEALKWQKGITNMAQAFTLADRMLREKGRGEAQSAVMVVRMASRPWSS
jgi:Mg-chelatase subunit ChlD